MRILIKTFLLLAFLPAGNASAITLDFTCVTGNSASNCALGEAQFSVDVSASSASGTDFLFNNLNTGAGVNPAIHEVYFASSVLLGITSSDDEPNSDVRLIEGGGVDFSLDSLSPPNLPGHTDVGFTPVFGAQSRPGATNAMQEGEILTVNIKTLEFSIFLAALIHDFRIGIHVHSFADGGSESFATSVVPVPAAFWLFGSALVGFIGFSRRRSV